MTRKSPYWPIFLGALAAFTLLPIISIAAAYAMERWVESQERSQQVIRTNSRVVSRDDSSIVVHVTGTRLRGDECRYTGIVAYTADSSGVLKLANIALVEQPARNASRPIGAFDAGHWRLWPIDKAAVRALAYTLYVCRGVDVRAVFFEVSLG